MDRKYLSWILSALIVLAIVNIAFIILVLSPAKDPIFDFSTSKTSNIATTISGLTTPLLTLLSAYLLYLTLAKQTEANEVQKIRNDVDTIVVLYNQLDSEYANLHYREIIKRKTDGKAEERIVETFSGPSALLKICNSFYYDPPKFNTSYEVDQVKALVSSYKLIERTVDQLTEDKTKKIFKEKLKHFYNFKLRDYIAEMAFYTRMLPNENKPEVIFEFFIEKQREYYPSFDLYSFKNLGDLFAQKPHNPFNE